MFDFDQGGRLIPRLPTARLGMKFRWRERPVTTALRTAGDGGQAILALHIEAGRVPSSATAAQARPEAFALLRCLPGLLPKAWKLTVAPNHSLVLNSEMAVALPALLTDLLVPAVQFCLAVSPFLDLLEENRMGPQA